MEPINAKIAWVEGIAIFDELKKRNLELLSSKELLDLIRYLEARLSEESSKISYVTDKIAASSFPFEAELEKIPLFDWNLTIFSGFVRNTYRYFLQINEIIYLPLNA